MPILAEQVDVVIGVDAHTDTHTAAMLSAAGAVLAELTVDADDRGATALLAWAANQAGDLRRQWVVDGARSHGVGLTVSVKRRRDGARRRPHPRLDAPSRRQVRPA